MHKFHFFEFIKKNRQKIVFPHSLFLIFSKYVTRFFFRSFMTGCASYRASTKYSRLGPSCEPDLHETFPTLFDNDGPGRAQLNAVHAAPNQTSATGSILRSPRPLNSLDSRSNAVRSFPGIESEPAGARSTSLRRYHLPINGIRVWSRRAH